MKRFLGILLSTLIVATMAATLIDIGVASATVLGVTAVGAQTPSPVAVGSSVTYAVTIQASGADWVEASLSSTPTGVTGSSTCVQEPNTDPASATVTMTLTTSGTTPPGSTPISVGGDNFTTSGTDCAGSNPGIEGTTMASTLAVGGEGEVVSFNSNFPDVAGGSGSLSNENFTSGVPQALATNTFADTGYTFTGWNTIAGGGGAAYANGQTITISANLSLYAQWSLNSTGQIVTFNANDPNPGGAGGSMASESFTSGVPQALTTNTFTDTGYTFTGWNTSAGGGGTAYSNAQTITISANLSLFAQWSLNPTTVIVSASGGGPPSMTLVQTSPTTGVTTSANSGTFSAGPITVSGATGAVSFAVTTTSKALSVSPRGAITTSGTLLVGSYSISGTDGDLSGDTGAWTYTLTVNNPSVTLTFNANGGTGSMAPESEDVATPLVPNVFKRATHAFTKWNTAANGSGVSYANGATYSFLSPVTLYAQWAATKHHAVSHRVTFNANGGTGTMTVQSNSVLTLLKTNAFTRAGYTFKGWNTKPGGLGTDYADGAAYRFAKSTTLYAQWTKKGAIEVAFRANGGRGTMADEIKTPAGLLVADLFTRSGYNFKGWNTKPDGSGTSYANGAAYSFVKSTTLYAQWAKKAVVIIPAVNAVVTLSPFVSKTATLSSSLEAQITALAADIKANHDTKIALVGFSGDLTTADASNEEVWSANLKLARARANAVESYLEQQLATIGVTRYTITASASTAALPVSSNAKAASGAKNDKVVATLT